MNKLILSFLIGIIAINSFAQIPNGYYDDAQGLSGESLKTALSNIIDNHNTQSYGSLWIHFESTDPKPNGKVWDMYSDVPGGTPPYEYNFGDDQCGNYSAEGDCYNREHSFPKSWFNDASPMYSDLFQLVPSDGYVNGRRSNWPYGEVGSASWTSQNGSKVGSNNTSGYSGTVFEPIDEYKGDFARIYFYMATRYEDQIAGWENNSSSSDAALDGTSYPCYEEWYLNLLLDWNSDDPVSQKEIDRNNEIYDIQDNRNPYVDHPEYVNQVWGGVMAPAITNVNWEPNVPLEDEAVSVTATITDDGSVVSAQLKYGFSSSNLNQTVTMTSNGSTYSAEIPGQDAGQDVYFRITATDDESNTSQSAVYNYQVNGNSTTLELPFLEDFNDETLGVFNQYSVTGTEQFWHNDDYEDAYYAKMSNYNGDDNIENEDWMITPAINFNNYSNETMTFQSAMKDYSDNSTFIYLKYSTNYAGSGNPNNATWTDLTSQATWSAGEYAWTASGEIDLTGINGTAVYIAFIYESEAGSGKTWQIDDVSITVDGSGNQPPAISNVDYTPEFPDANEAVTVSAVITDDESVESAVVLWGLSAGNLSNTQNMTSSGDNYSAEIPGQDEGTTVYFKVQATDNGNLMNESTVYNYTIDGNSNTAPEISNVNYTPEIPDANEAVTVSAVITDDESVESALVLWGLSQGSLSNIEDMTASGDNYSAEIPGQDAGTTVYFKVQAFDSEGEMDESEILNYTVDSPLPLQTLPFTEDFENEDLGIFNSYSVTGDEQYWHNDDYNGMLYAKMSNYNGDDNLENEDWLLTKSINFDNYTNEVMTFESSMMDYDDNNTHLYLKYSWNYDGVSNPNTATWIDITGMATWSAGEYDWEDSGEINLNMINGTSVYIAFVYESEDGSGKTWQLDNISINLDGLNQAPVIAEISHTPTEPHNGNDVVVSAQITDDTGLDVTELQYGFSPSQMDEVIDMSGSGNTFTGTIPAQEAGQYVYYRIYAIDDEGASSYSSIINYYVDLAEGVSEANNANIAIYPNPAHTYFELQIEGQNIELDIYNTSGSIIKHIENYQSLDKISINDINAGIYIIKINNNGVLQYRKLIVK